ncbi:hypothetical protein D3C86_1962270 [compost metagenome]
MMYKGHRTMATSMVTRNKYRVFIQLLTITWISVHTYYVWLLVKTMHLVIKMNDIDIIRYLFVQICIRVIN